MLSAVLTAVPALPVLVDILLLLRARPKVHARAASWFWREAVRLYSLEAFWKRGWASGTRMRLAPRLSALDVDCDAGARARCMS